MAAKDFRRPSGKSDKPDPSKKAKADWRTKGKAGARTKRAKSAAWTEKTGGEYKHAKLRYRLKIGAWLAILGTLVGIFVVYLVWRPGYTPFLAMTVTRYGDEMAGVVGPNAWAAEDAERFRELGGTSHRVLKYSLVPYATEEPKADGLKGLRRKLLDDTKPGGPGKNLVIVYLSMHGAVDGDGRPCLLPPDASPYDTNTWLPLEDAIGYLFPKDKIDRLPEKKLLILDCNRMDVNWRLGLLYNGFADRLEEVIRKAEVPGLIILNSTSPGQIGWTSPGRFQGSVFGHYLYLGLCGEADGKGPRGKADKRVSLSELYAYLQAGVGQWVLGNRDDNQRPMLLPADADVDLVFNKKHQPDALPASDLRASARWAEVARLWTEYHQANQDVAPRLRPMLWETFQHKLMRLERLLIAGSEYEKEFARVAKEVQALADQLGVNPLPEGLAAYSLPLARRLNWVPAGGTAGARQADLDAAEKCWASILADPSGAGWSEQLGGVDAGGRGAGVVELQFARMLQRYLDPDTWRENGELVRLSLSTRQLAERVAAPAGDAKDAVLCQRAHYWTGRAVDGADEDRRLAEDRLFVGAPDELKTAQEIYGQLIGGDAGGGKYGDAARLAEKVRAAYELRDRVRATAPYLAQWLFARLSRPAASELGDLSELIRATAELETKLDESLAAATWPIELDQLAGLVAQKLDALRDSFDRECSALEDAGLHDSDTLRNISEVLGTPLVTGASRMLLLEKLIKADASRGDGVDPVAGSGGSADDAGNGADKGNDDALAQYAARLKGFSGHPAVTLLGGGGQAEATKASDPDEEVNPRVVFYQPGQTVRKLLASLEDGVEELTRQTDRALATDDDVPESPAAVRSGLAAADRLVRRAAPLAVAARADYRKETRPEPAVMLRRLDLHYLLLWHCYRSIEDFWGPADTEGVEQPYFETVAREYLDSAGKLAPPATVAAHGKIDLAVLLEARLKAVLRPEASNLQVDSDEFAGPSELKVSVAAGEDLPRGEAAIYLADSSGETAIPLLSSEELAEPDLRRIGIQIAPVKGSGEAEMAVPSRWVAGGSLEGKASRPNIIALYRGHRMSGPIVVERLGAGIPIEYVPPKYADPVVTVFGDAVRKSSVMFIFDCSGSMDNKMATADDTRTTTTSRFIEAKEALGVILSELADVEDSPYQVGVLAYGHRVGWRGQNEQVTWDPEIPTSKSRRGERIPKSAVEEKLPHPNSDIQQIWPLSRFTQFERQSLLAKLDELRPLGETPLYLSIIETVNALRRGKTPVNHIIAITDGVDDRSDVDAGDKILPSHVKEAIDSLGAGKVRLDIVAINTQDKDIQQHVDRIMPNHTPADREEEFKERVGRRDELVDLARHTGGEFYPADDPDRLLAALKDSLQLSRYEVVKLPGGGQPVASMPLGKKAQIQQASDAEVDYLVRVPDREQPAQAKITLLGGEGLELYLNRPANRLLEHRRYYDQERAAGRDSVEEVPNPGRSDDSEPASLFIAAHLPARDGSSVRFDVSIQNQDETAFSPRPVEAWVQISPLVSGGEPAGDYIFYDLVFVEDRPVPVIECVAPLWPAGAERAEIRMFCKFRATEAEKTNVITVDEFADRGTYAVDGVPGVRFRLEKRRGEAGRDYRIVVVESHSEGSRLDVVKIAMDPPPKLTVHRFRHKTADVYHTFYYDDAAAADAGRYRVIFSPRSALSENAVAPSKPLVVRIPD